MNEPALIHEILDRVRTIAVIGLTDREGRASYGVSRFMQSQGYRIVPVNPRIERSLGEVAYPDLDAAYSALDGKIELVNVFRAPNFVPEIVKDVIRLKIPYLWLQDGVQHDDAIAKAEAAGVKAIQNDCIFREHAARH